MGTPFPKCKFLPIPRKVSDVQLVKQVVHILVAERPVILLLAICELPGH